jgi:glycosyltransferase involved in cell wall biosynthesis
MKVLHCISTAKIGGIERLVIELAVAQKEAGLEVSIMLDQREGQFLDEIITNQISILESKITNGFEFNFRKLDSLKKVFCKFDIVHLHNFSLLRSHAAIRSGAKVVYTIHGLSKGIRKENILKYLLRETLKKKYLNKVDFIIYNSNFTMNGAKKDYSLSPLSKVVFNGSKLDDFKPSPLKLQRKNLIVGLVTRFTSRKRVDRLVTSFEIFLTSGGHGKLILVGDGQTFPAIKTLINQKNISDHVELVGYSNKVAEYYKKFDLCVFPSEQEPFGLVAVEAYNFGLPVLAFKNSGGLMEIIHPIEPNNIVENENQLAERLHFYQMNRDEFSIEKCNERKEYAQQNFSIHRMEREYFEVYNTLIND